MLAEEQCSRYRINGSSLVIRDVAEEDAGKYTVLAQIKEHGLYRNLTFTLVVNGEKHAFTSNPSTTAASVTEQAIKCVWVRVCVCVCVYVCVCGGWGCAVSPQIGEKAVSLQDPGSVRRGSRQTLRCTSHGVPPPHVQWLWHRCPPKGL